MTSIAGVFIAIGVVLNLMLWALVIRPIGRLSQFADRVSLGELEIPEYTRTSSDEIGVLSLTTDEDPAQRLVPIDSYERSVVGDFVVYIPTSAAATAGNWAFRSVVALNTQLTICSGARSLRSRATCALTSTE